MPIPLTDQGRVCLCFLLLQPWCCALTCSLAHFWLALDLFYLLYRAAPKAGAVFQTQMLCGLVQMVPTYNGLGSAISQNDTCHQ